MRQILAKQWFHCSLAVVGALIALSFFFGAQKGWSGDYCTRCGLERSRRAIIWLGLSVPYEIRYGDNRFHQLYTRYVSPTCRHHWRFYAGSSGLVWTGPTEFGDGRFPLVLSSTANGDLRRLSRIHDRSRIGAVLRSFILRGDGTSIEEADMWEAIRQLEYVSTADQEERWWHRYQDLFVPPTEARHAADRVPS